MTRVLITNDDGISAPGLRYLAAAAVDHGFDVVVAAPLKETSGSSAAMSAYTADGKVIIEPRQLPDLPDVVAYGVGASPSYIVVLAMLSTFGEPPELVLSGINRGANAGRAVLHSGTVGAALTAASHGCPAMAISLDVISSFVTETGGSAMEVLSAADDEGRNWDAAARLVRTLLPSLPETPGGTVLNLNVPDMPYEEMRGIRHATLAEFGQVQMTIAEQGDDFVRTATEKIRMDAAAGTDLALLSEGFATVTALRPVSEIPELRLPLPEVAGDATHGERLRIEAEWRVAPPEQQSDDPAPPEDASRQDGRFRRGRKAKKRRDAAQAAAGTPEPR